MKKIFVAAVAIFALSVATANAQSPTPDPDTTSAPVKQTDPEVDVMPRNVDYTGGMVKISVDKLPDEVKQALAKGKSYQGWEDGTAYRDKAGRTFAVEIKQNNKMRIFRFDEDGKLILD